MKTRKLLLIVGIIAAVVGVTAAVEYTTHTISNELTVVEGSADFTSDTDNIDWDTLPQGEEDIKLFFVTNEGDKGDYVEWEEHLPSDINSNMWYTYMNITTITHSQLENYTSWSVLVPHNNSTLSMDWEEYSKEIGVLHWWPKEDAPVYDWCIPPYLEPGESLLAMYEINVGTTCQPDDSYTWDLNIGKD